uniref:Schlafen AlbA-2 domain-containing protein n=1 Tax=Lates calcarifer TaxID=8187 RepID=A0A4W6DK38_LATCA
MEFFVDFQKICVTDVLIRAKTIDWLSEIYIYQTCLTEKSSEEISSLVENVEDGGDEVKKDQSTSSTNKPGRPCKPYPFCRYHDSYRYIINNVIDTTESGTLDMIEPCHEFKAYTSVTDKNTESNLIDEVIRFGAACMNSRTNGTIHFGIGDKHSELIHGQVLGVVIKDKEDLAKKLKSAIDGYFFDKDKQSAHRCIKPPRFVGVLNRNRTSSDKCVIEVDIVPDSTICKENNYHTSKFGTRNLLTERSMKEYKKFIHDVKQRSQLRKEAEEKSLAVTERNYQGSTLSEMITGGSLSLEKSQFEQYVIVTNKAYSKLNPKVVLDFDPESAKHGLLCHFEQHSAVNVHLPAQYKITEQIEDIANKLELSQKTSWVFCNGGIEDEAPSDIDQWLMDKGASIQDVISFWCRKDVLPNKRFLVIFLLWSTVSEELDPLVETFYKFQKELGGTDQILCICDSENAFTSWKDLIEARCGIDISGRCIYKLSFAEVSGTILSLSSKNHRSNRFLTSDGGSRVLLMPEVEHSLNTLDILCVNQCEGGNEDNIVIDKDLYREGKASWQTFYYSEQPGSSFIKQKKIDLIENKVKVLRSQTKACVLFNLIHAPGCGGTTLAMHTLWTLRDRYRCAVLKDNDADLSVVTDQLVKLLTYGHEEKLPHVPVMLMIDDFDDMKKVAKLQQLIEEECIKKNIKSTQVILLNCMRSESPLLPEVTKDTVFLGNDLSDEEQKQFTGKKPIKTFYELMAMKTNLKSHFIHNTLKTFSIDEKHAKLLAILTILNVYCEDSSLSVSLCQKYLGLSKPICGTDRVQEAFGKFSNLISYTTVKGELEYKAVKIIHPKFAEFCLRELKTTHKMTKAEITNLLLTTDEFYETTDGKLKLLEDVHHIIVGRHLVEQSIPMRLCCIFSCVVQEAKQLAKGRETKQRKNTLIQDIENETPGLEEKVLLNSLERFKNDPSITQLLNHTIAKKRREGLGFWNRVQKKFSKMI